MKFLYVPWRSKYVKNTREHKDKEYCPFCEHIKDKNNDEQNFILARFKYNFAILNLHPYNTGHLMIIPFKHIKSLNELSSEEKNEMMELISQSCEILKNKLSAHGINIGANLGAAAGAGIPDHLHMHVIPRWPGDTNFLPVIAQTKTISLDLNVLYKDLKEEFQKLKV